MGFDTTKDVRNWTLSPSDSIRILSLICAGLLLPFSLLSAAEITSAPAKPNVVFILADDKYTCHSENGQI